MPVTTEQYNKARSLLSSGNVSPAVKQRLQSVVDAHDAEVSGNYEPEMQDYQPPKTDIGGYFYEPSVEDFRKDFFSS